MKRWFLKSTLSFCITVAMALASEAAQQEITIGGHYSAADSLACEEDGLEDAKACVAKLSWPAAKFSVRLEVAERGCGDYLVRFPSPKSTGYEKNDLVAMEWYAARDADSAIRTARPIVVVHESGSNMTVGRLIARGLNGHGLHAFLLQLPGYGARRVPEQLAALEQTIPRLQQAIADVRRARDAVVALPMVDDSVVGVQGTSLGGFVTATVAGLDHGYDRSFVFLAGGDLQEVVLHGERDAAKFRAKLKAAGVSDEQIRMMARDVEPLRLAHRINPATMWLYTGKYDQVVPSRCSLALAKAAHLPDSHCREFPADHYSGVIYMPEIVEEVYRQMTEPLADDK
jgi:dienelactone hydrolase